ncbi:methyl-accepting chemotaxis protein [Massilia timonae]|uniref:Methyl-accepting chemotaxis (MCP) signaling domain protein n=1 Tax=Massilia timonae TaxID=47229 RepID=A0A1S2NAT2_9BURK|nr:methyl-accepting chemotaxis protein [Massilia timonae]OIJ42155.1 methyl-accepting chemotaxis (MCP) signaling domain protein [Massilia timonae]
MKKLNIGARLGIGFAIVLVLLLAMSATALTRMQSAADLTDRLVNTSIKNQRSVAEWRRNIEINSAINETVYYAVDAGILDVIGPRRQAITSRSNVLQKEIEESLRNPAVREQFMLVKEQRLAYMAARDALFQAKRAGDQARLDAIYREQLSPRTVSYLATVDKFAAMQISAADGVAQSILASYASTRVILFTLGGAALLLGAACAWFISRSITAPLREALDVAERVAGGDLTSQFSRQALERGDEVGQLMAALSRMNASLAAIVGQVRDGTATIATASGEIASGNQDLSSRTEQQAGSLEETAASMEELTSTVRQNTEHARRANGLAANAAGVAGEGGKMVADVVGTMGRIDAASQRIVDIIGVIDGIAFQTNILALNAAVEAARAGEQGRGFAVVAGEVRTLAHRSAAAAKEIKGLIDDSVSQVQQGTQQVARAGATMEQIVHSIEQVTVIMGEIAAASEEQSAGIEQVNTAIVEMDRVTQQNAALVEEAAAAADAMRDQAAQLSAVVGTFRLEQGAAAAPHARRAAPAARPVLAA